MDISNIIPHIEALIFASDKPLTSLELTDLTNNAFGFMEDKITLDQVESAIEGIIEKYSASFYPFEMRESGGGWQFLTKKDFHKTVAQLNGEKFLKRLSSASLETLAIIAYKQPITKGEIEAIRGVNSDYSIQKLLEKELIIITGRNEALPGKPLVYATSRGFMDYFGINSPEELPRIKEVLAQQEVLPTAIQTDMQLASENVSPSPDEMDLFSVNASHAGENELQPASEELSLVVRGNGELIQETLVVNEETKAIDPEAVISTEENLDDAVEKNMKEEINEAASEIEGDENKENENEEENKEDA